MFSTIFLAAPVSGFASESGGSVGAGFGVCGAEAVDGAGVVCAPLNGELLTGTGEEFTPTLMETAVSVWEQWAPFIIVAAASLFIVISRIVPPWSERGHGASRRPLA